MPIGSIHELTSQALLELFTHLRMAFYGYNGYNGYRGAPPPYSAPPVQRFIGIPRQSQQPHAIFFDGAGGAEVVSARQAQARLDGGRRGNRRTYDPPVGHYVIHHPIPGHRHGVEEVVPGLVRVRTWYS